MLPRVARGQSGGMKKIYLVEDSPFLRERLLTLIGGISNACIVGFADTVNAAVTGISAEQPDIVLLDLHLRDGTGFEVMREMRGREHAPDFYMLTNYSTA